MPISGMYTVCDGCGHHFIITTVDNDGILIGDACPKCEYYTTRYMPDLGDIDA